MRMARGSHHVTTNLGLQPKRGVADVGGRHCDTDSEVAGLRGIGQQDSVRYLKVARPHLQVTLIQGIGALHTIAITAVGGLAVQRVAGTRQALHIVGVKVVATDTNLANTER